MCFNFLVLSGKLSFLYWVSHTVVQIRNPQLKSDYNIYVITIILLHYLYYNNVNINKIILIIRVWLQNNENRDLWNLTDNLIKFFMINKFGTRKLQSIWSTVYLPLLYFIARVELKANSTCCFTWLLGFFRFFFFSARL